MIILEVNPLSTELGVFVYLTLLAELSFKKLIIKTSAPFAMTCRFVLDRGISTL